VEGGRKRVHAGKGRRALKGGGIIKTFRAMAWGPWSHKKPADGVGGSPLVHQTSKGRKITRGEAMAQPKGGRNLNNTTEREEKR